MSTMVMAACWPLQMPPTPKAVLMSLADNANDDGQCWPSIATICQRTCFGKTAVIEAIAWLESVGRLTADRSNGRHSKYQIIPNLDLFDGQNQTASRTGAPAEPVREANRLEQNRTACRTPPVRQADTNRQEPKARSKAEAEAKAPPPAKKPPAAREPIPEPPGWVDVEAWHGFVEMRKRLRFPLTARAATLIFHELEKLRTKGHDPTTVLDQSTRNGWRDVYPIKPENPDATSPPSRKRSVVERIEANILARRAREAAPADAAAAAVPAARPG